MAATATILSVKDLSVIFEGEQPFVAVDHISFSIDQGKTLAVVGESGSGKSLTALSLMGLLPKQATVKGSIVLLENELTTELLNIDKDAWRTIRGNEVTMIFQEPMSSLNPIMKVGKQLTECILEHQPLTKQLAKQKSIEWLHKVQLPNPLKIYERYPHQLSGGQKQRLMIAMAMCNEPALLIADEPTTALDVTVQKEILQLMQQLQKEQQMAMIFITHDLALAGDIADDVLVMYKGKIAEYGATKKVLTAPEHAYTRALIASKPKPEQKNTKLPTVADFMDSSKNIVPVQYAATIKDEEILAVNGLKVWYTEDTDLLGRPTAYLKAVDDVSFNICKGEVVGLVGESGCGKSTIGRSLLGLLPMHKGQIIFEGKDISKIKGKEWNSIRRDIQMIFQDPFASLNPRMTVGDILSEPLKVHDIVPRKELRKEAARLIDQVHLPQDSLKRYPHQFSGGQRQRIGIARALALRPKLIVCDESVSALDVSVQAQILNLLKELQQQFDLSYLFISHDLSVVHYISDRVIVMKTGEIVEAGSAGDVLKHPSHPYTRMLIDAMPSF